MNRRILILGVVVLAAVGAIIVGVTQSQGKDQSTYSADVVSALSGSNDQGFAKATTVRDFTFPRDFGAHPEYQTEWWYYTGNLSTPEGRRFGFEFTIFRRAISPTLPSRQSDWATNQIY